MGSGFCNQRLLGSLISRQQKPFFGSHAKQNSFSSTLLYKKHDRAVLGPGGVCCKAGSEDQPRPTQLKLTDLLKPDWPDKVTNWQEVMMADEDSWLDLGEDIDEIDDDLDEHDFEALSGGRSQRAGWAVDVISKRIPDLMKTNEDFVSFMPVGPKPRYTADIPTPIEHLKPVKMPMDDWELRAMVEKRRQAKAVDEDWQRRRAEVGKFKYLSISHTTDVRVMEKPFPLGYGEVPQVWSHQEVMDLITMGGKAPLPEENGNFEVRNLEANADYHSLGVTYVPETDEFLRSIGHLAEHYEEPDTNQDITLLESDFADFVDEDGVNEAGDEAGLEVGQSWSSLEEAEEAES